MNDSNKMIPNSQISVQRRMAEAVSAKMNYDFLCFRGSIMGEAYLGHSISEILASFFDQTACRARNNFAHPVLSSTKKGRKPEIDYVVEYLANKQVMLAVEAKWAGSSHCTAENILWDLVRLKALKDSVDHECGTYFLLAGKREDIDKPFNAKLFRQGTQSPLIAGSQRKKSFSLSDNRDHQRLIDKQKKIWLEAYSELSIPEHFKTKLVDDSRSAANNMRFVSRIWEIL
ncbi:hypothetical protein [Halomonas sp. G11]|uniref:hypothetical protein n=1 Tax=Halomonas sp. G11 TaxID=1684425 RepID=UPI0007FDA099|nr:hypothetical protein [Halomonas sp. G11]OAZ99912.1 hypothetical protein ADS46_12545 [Halomonas sp. G11]